MQVPEKALEVLVLDADSAVLMAALRARVPAEVRLVAAAGADEVTGAPDVCVGRPDLFAEAADRLDSVRWVQSTWAGVEPMLEVLRRRPELMATAARGIFGDAIAEYVLGWVLALDRRLLDYAGQQAKQDWAVLPDRSLAGRRAAVFGLGSIGNRVAERLGQLGMQVVGVSRAGVQLPGVARTYPSARRAEAARGADLLVSVLPGTPATRGLVDAPTLEALARGAVFINVGRGGVVADEVLLGALASGRLGAAVLDVFDVEPLPRDHCFWTTPNLHVTPHVAARTRPEDIARAFAANLARWRQGRVLEGLVDPVRGY